MTNSYEAPWSDRYASKQFLELFSKQHRYETWRTLWLWLAEAQAEEKLPITAEQLNQMRSNITNIDFDAVLRYELEFKHDVMAHIRAFADVAPLAAPIIHLGATSCYVTDNADLIIYRQALRMLASSLAAVMESLAAFAERYKTLPCLGFTHFQSASAITVGKRATLWLSSLLQDLKEIEHVASHLTFRSIKGATGSAESFKKLLNGDYQQYKRLERAIADKASFTMIESVTGQTYNRKIDSAIMAPLLHLSESIHKITNDLRLLQHLKEIEEPFSTHQVGSSAMAYKRNPMKSERASSLAKFVISLSSSPSLVASTQWLERTLDDSANRRLVLPQAFLACDSMLRIMSVLADGLVVYPKIIAKHLNDELPLMATEHIIMEAVKQGGDRGRAHEAVRRCSMKVTQLLKEEGVELNLLALLAEEADLYLSHDDISNLLNPQLFIGFSVEQSSDFLNNELYPAIKEYKNGSKVSSSLTL